MNSWSCPFSSPKILCGCQDFSYGAVHELRQHFCKKGEGDWKMEKNLWRTGTKGQLILKGLFGIFNSSKKRTEKFDLTTIVPQVDLFSFIFWKNLKTPKIHFEINWPLKGHFTAKHHGINSWADFYLAILIREGFNERWF